jgi:hypothetical protein
MYTATPTPHEAAIPNTALQPLSVLVGEWELVGTHPNLTGTQHGHARFDWMEGGAFLMMRWQVSEPGIPSATAIFGSDDTKGTFYMLYFDERGVSRLYETTLDDHTWKLWRYAPGFSQRFTGRIEDNGNRIVGVWELSEDDATWKRDLELTYTRVSESR